MSATKSTTTSNRAELNANARLLVAIPRGSAVNVVGSAGTGPWVRVRYNNITGFVNGRFLSDTRP